MLRGAMGTAAFDELMVHFKEAVFATQETDMLVKWELVMAVCGIRIND